MKINYIKLIITQKGIMVVIKLFLVGLVSVGLVGCASNQQSQIQDSNQINPVGAVAGGLIGGVVGAQIGGGSGNVIATSVGAATGTLIGAGCQRVNSGQIIGGLAGAIIGSQIGHGDGRTAAAIGASTGVLIGNDMAGGCN